MKNLKKTAGLISTAVTAVLFVLILGLLVIQMFGIKPYIVMSGSMEPTIHTGSVCFVNTSADYSDIKKGDIIAFQAAENMLVTHRAVAVSDAGIETKGDANKVSDGISTTKDNFIGRTVFSLPYVGYWSQALQTAQGRIIEVSVAAVLVLSAFITRKDNCGEKQ